LATCHAYYLFGKFAAAGSRGKFFITDENSSAARPDKKRRQEQLVFVHCLTAEILIN